MEVVSRKKIESRRVNHAKTGNTALQLDRMGKEHLRRRYSLRALSLSESLICFSRKSNMQGKGPYVKW